MQEGTAILLLLTVSVLDMHILNLQRIHPRDHCVQVGTGPCKPVQGTGSVGWMDMTYGNFADPSSRCEPNEEGRTRTKKKEQHSETRLTTKIDVRTFFWPKVTCAEGARKKF